MNKRGWLASALLAAAVIGGYLGLLPLLSSLAAGPAWPDPIATRDASGVVTAVSLSTDAPTEQAPPAPSGENDVVAITPDEGASTEPDSEPVANAGGNKGSSKVVVHKVVGGGLERLTKPRPAIVTGGGSNGGSGDSGSSGGSSGSSGGGSSNGGGGSAGSGGSGGSTPLPEWDGNGAGSLAGGGSGAVGGGDDEATAGG